MKALQKAPAERSMGLGHALHPVRSETARWGAPGKKWTAARWKERRPVLPRAAKSSSELPQDWTQVVPWARQEFRRCCAPELPDASVHLAKACMLVALEEEAARSGDAVHPELQELVAAMTQLRPRSAASASTWSLERLDSLAAEVTALLDGQLEDTAPAPPHHPQQGGQAAGAWTAGADPQQGEQAAGAGQVDAGSSAELGEERNGVQQELVDGPAGRLVPAALGAGLEPLEPGRAAAGPAGQLAGGTGAAAADVGPASAGPLHHAGGGAAGGLASAPTVAAGSAGPAAGAGASGAPCAASSAAAAASEPRSDVDEAGGSGSFNFHAEQEQLLDRIHSSRPGAVGSSSGGAGQPLGPAEGGYFGSAWPSGGPRTYGRRHQLYRKYPVQTLGAVNTVLFERHGYRACNRYGVASDHQLAAVLEGGCGGSAALSILYLEVCERLGFPLAARPLEDGRYFVLWPVEAPLTADGQRFLVDPYGRGGLLLLDEVCEIFGVEPCVLRPASRRELLAALLGELRDTHWAAALGCSPTPGTMTALTAETALANKVSVPSSGVRAASLRRALAAAEKRLWLLPHDSEAQLQYALLLYFTRRWDDAWIELALYLERFAVDGVSGAGQAPPPPPDHGPDHATGPGQAPRAPDGTLSQADSAAVHLAVGAGGPAGGSILEGSPEAAPGRLPGLAGPTVGGGAGPAVAGVEPAASREGSVATAAAASAVRTLLEKVRLQLDFVPAPIAS